MVYDSFKASFWNAAAPTDVQSLFKLLLFAFSVHFLCSLIFLFPTRFSTRKEGCWLLKLVGAVTETRWITVAWSNNLPIDCSWLQLLWIWSNPCWCFTQWNVQKWFPGIHLTSDSWAVQPSSFKGSNSQSPAPRLSLDSGVFPASISAGVNFKQRLWG